MQWSSLGVLVKSVWVFKLKSFCSDHSWKYVFDKTWFFSHFFPFLPITTASVYIGQITFCSSVLWRNLQHKQRDRLYKPARKYDVPPAKADIKTSVISSAGTYLKHMYRRTSISNNQCCSRLLLSRCYFMWLLPCVIVSSTRCHYTKSIWHSQELNQEQKLFSWATSEVFRIIFASSWNRGILSILVQIAFGRVLFSRQKEHCQKKNVLLSIWSDFVKNCQFEFMGCPIQSRNFSFHINRTKISATSHFSKS